MPYKVTIKLADDTEKEFEIGSDVELPSGLELGATQITNLLSALGTLTRLMGSEEWKTIEIELET